MQGLGTRHYDVLGDPPSAGICHLTSRENWIEAGQSVAGSLGYSLKVANVYQRRFDSESLGNCPNGLTSLHYFSPPGASY